MHRRLFAGDLLYERAGPNEHCIILSPYFLFLWDSESDGSIGILDKFLRTNWDIFQ